MFFDPRQNLFEGTEPRALHRVTDCDPAQFRLTINCRNTVAIASATALLVDQRCDATLTIDGPDVTIGWYSSEADEAAVLSAELMRLLAGGLSRSEIVLLSGRTFAETPVVARIRDAFAISMETDPREPAVRFMTVQAFKGLEADAVLLVGVNELDSPIARRNLYVGASRARVFLGVMLDRRLEQSYQALAVRFGERLVSVHSTAG